MLSVLVRVVRLAFDRGRTTQLVWKAHDLSYYVSNVLEANYKQTDERHDLELLIEGLQNAKVAYMQALLIDGHNQEAKRFSTNLTFKIGKLQQELRTKSFSSNGGMSVKTYASLNIGTSFCEDELERM
eukprot:SAG31_NODE_11381_length_1037_cov_0.922175_1_plen_128_part_00